MYYSKLNEENVTRNMTTVWGGYNRGDAASESEFFDMHNMTSSYYPVLSPRDERGIIPVQGVFSENAVLLGLHFNSFLMYIIEEQHSAGKLLDRIYVRESPEKSLTSLTLASDGDLHFGKVRKIVSMGAYVIIWPDMVRINMENRDASGDFVLRAENLAASFDSSVSGSDTVIWYPCDINKLEDEETSGGTSDMPLDFIDFAAPPDDDYSDEPPANPANGDLWLDTQTGITNGALKKYSSVYKTWADTAPNYAKIKCTGIGAKFKKGDIVTISGLHTYAYLLNKENTIVYASDDCIVVEGLIWGYQQYSLGAGGGAINDVIKVVKRLPDLDFIVESENRLWGCRYGMQTFGGTEDGEFVNEIYASALGDPSMWQSFRGISSDSYTASVGTDGEFTGAAVYQGHPMFFKPDCIHKIYGNVPSNYQVITTVCEGVEKGSCDSLAVCGGRLYYKSPRGIMAYDGSYPRLVSSALGFVKYSEAVAGELFGKYYVSMKDENGAYHLFVYDTERGMWHREDSSKVISFARLPDNLYFISEENGEYSLLSVTADGQNSTDKPVMWHAVTGYIGFSDPDNKYISRFNVRLSAAPGDYADFFIEYDSSGVFEHKGHIDGEGTLTQTLPIMPRRCDHMRLKISGCGNVKIYSIAKLYEKGSDL